LFIKITFHKDAQRFSMIQSQYVFSAFVIEACSLMGLPYFDHKGNNK